MSDIYVRYPNFKSLPQNARLFTNILFSICLILIIFILLNKPFVNINWFDFFVFLVCSTTVLLKPILVNQDRDAIGIASIFWIAAMFIFDPGIVFFIVLLSQLISDIATKASSWALVHNISELPISYYLAALSYQAFKPNQAYYDNILAYLLPLLIALTIANVVNYGLHFIMYHFLYKEEPLVNVFKIVTEGLILYEMSQIPIGILLALTYHFQRISIILFLLPITFFYITYTYQSRVQQKEREAVEEKRRIEQDAHDRIYNRLGALAKKAELALDSPTQMEPTLSLIKDDLQKSVADLQNIIRGEVEVAEIAEENYLQKELSQICEAFKNKSDVKLSFNCDESLVASIAPQHFWHLQCIIEECLNNIHKHSKATEASVQFQKEDTSILVTIADNGTGMKTLSNDDCRISNEIQIENRKSKIVNRKSGLGLPGMRDRAKKIGAEISVSTNNGSGTRVELRLPSSH